MTYLSVSAFYLVLLLLILVALIKSEITGGSLALFSLSALGASFAFLLYFIRGIKSMVRLEGNLTLQNWEVDERPVFRQTSRTPDQNIAVKKKEFRSPQTEEPLKVSDISLTLDEVTIKNVLRGFLIGPSSWELFKDSVVEDSPKGRHPVINEDVAMDNYRSYPFALYIRASSKRLGTDKSDTDFRYGNFILLAPHDILTKGIHEFVMGELKRLDVDWRVLSSEGSF